MNKNIKGIDNEVIRALISYEWKGEVRELENVMERAVIFCKNDFITLKDLPETFSQASSSVDFSKLGSLEVAIRRFEKEYILKALESNSNDKEKTSELLQVGLSTLYRKLKELDISH